MKKIITFGILIIVGLFIIGCSGTGEEDGGFMSGCGCSDMFSGCGCGGEGATDDATSEADVQDTVTETYRDTGGVAIPEEEEETEEVEETGE